MKFAGLAVFLLLGACAVDKTPLTPLGELNVCLRDTALEAKENGCRTFRKHGSGAENSPFLSGKKESYRPVPG